MCKPRYIGPSQLIQCTQSYTIAHTLKYASSRVNFRVVLKKNSISYNQIDEWSV